MPIPQNSAAASIPPASSATHENLYGIFPRDVALGQTICDDRLFDTVVTPEIPSRHSLESESFTLRKVEPHLYVPAEPELKPSAKKPQPIRFKRGLDLPIAGVPEQKIEPAYLVTRVAVVGPDYVGMKPTMAVEVGDRVVTGQVLFYDKKQPGVCYTSPGCGTVVAVNRGAKRAFRSVVIKLEGTAAKSFTSYTDNELDAIPRQEVIRQLVDSGAWTSLRERPFDRVPSPMVFGPIDADEEQKATDATTATLTGMLRLINEGLEDGAAGPCVNGGVCTGCGKHADSASEAKNSAKNADSESSDSSRVPSALFITAIDTRPLAADPEVVIAQRAGYFYAGLRVLGRLGIAKNYLCTAPDAQIPGGRLKHIKRVEFAGPHPAGLVGTHIHTLEPVGRDKSVWHINYQDVIAIGRLFRTGKVDTERVVALAGPSVERPRLVRTRVGADLNELVEDQLVSDSAASNSQPGKVKPRVISGSVLSGRTTKERETAFLGRYDLQVSVLPEFENRELFGWITPGTKKFSVKNVVFSKLFGRGRRFAFDTAVHGGRRAIVPIGAYQKVMPLDILPDFLLKALSIGDLELSESLGCLELTEEDVALLTYVCPGKADYGVMLRRVLDELAKEV